MSVKYEQNKHHKNSTELQVEVQQPEFPVSHLTVCTVQ